MQVRVSNRVVRIFSSFLAVSALSLSAQQTPPAGPVLRPGDNPPEATAVRTARTVTASPENTPTTNATGTGTLNFLSKWTDNAGALGNSSIFDTGSLVGIGTAAPGGVLDIQRNSGSDLLMRMYNTGAGAGAGAKLRYVSGLGATAQLQLTDANDWLMAIAGNRTIGMQFRVTPDVATSEGLLDASARMTITRAGRVGIGTTAPTALLHVAGDAIIDGNIAAKYQDFAEWVPATTDMNAGTVVILNPEKSNEVMASERAYDTRVAGVVSAQPGIILGEASADKAMIATTGRVKVRVDATKRPIKVGDLLVTGDKPGTAIPSEAVQMSGISMHRPGTILGKALEPLASGEGEILVLLSLQ
jgi:hypothetical protein